MMNSGLSRAFAFSADQGIGLTDDDVRACMLDDVPELSADDIDVGAMGRDAWHVSIEKKIAGVKMIEGEFIFDAGIGYAKGVNVTIDPSLYGGRIGPRLTRNALNICQHINIDTFRFEAGAHMGGFVWAHNGAVLDGAPRPELIAELNFRVMAMKPFLPATDYYPMQDAAQLRQREDVRLIACDTNMLDQDQLAGALKNLPYMIAERLKANPMMKRASVCSGAFALAGTHYHAMISVTDPLPRTLLNKRIDSVMVTLAPR